MDTLLNHIRPCLYMFWLWYGRIVEPYQAFFMHVLAVILTHCWTISGLLYTCSGCDIDTLLNHIRPCLYMFWLWYWHTMVSWLQTTHAIYRWDSCFMWSPADMQNICRCMVCFVPGCDTSRNTRHSCSFLPVKYDPLSSMFSRYDFPIARIKGYLNFYKIPLFKKMRISSHYIIIQKLGVSLISQFC